MRYFASLSMTTAGALLSNVMLSGAKRSRSILYLDAMHNVHWLTIVYLELGNIARRPAHDKPLALGDHQPLVGVEIAKFLDPAAGPAHH